MLRIACFGFLNVAVSGMLIPPDEDPLVMLQGGAQLNADLSKKRRHRAAAPPSSARENNSDMLPDGASQSASQSPGKNETGAPHHGKHKHHHQKQHKHPIKQESNETADQLGKQGKTGATDDASNQRHAEPADAVNQQGKNKAAGDSNQQEKNETIDDVNKTVKGGGFFSHVAAAVKEAATTVITRVEDAVNKDSLAMLQDGADLNAQLDRKRRHRKAAHRVNAHNNSSKVLNATDSKKPVNGTGKPRHGKHKHQHQKQPRHSVKQGSNQTADELSEQRKNATSDDASQQGHYETTDDVNQQWKNETAADVNKTAKVGGLISNVAAAVKSAANSVMSKVEAVVNKESGHHMEQSLLPNDSQTERHDDKSDSSTPLWVPAVPEALVLISEPNKTLPMHKGMAKQRKPSQQRAGRKHRRAVARHGVNGTDEPPNSTDEHPGVMSKVTQIVKGTAAAVMSKVNKYIRRKRPSTDCSRIGTEYTGRAHELEFLEGMSSHTDCRKKCFDVQDCAFYTWFNYKGGCRLSKKGATMTKVSWKSVAGPRDCAEETTTSSPNVTSQDPLPSEHHNDSGGVAH